MLKEIKTVEVMNKTKEDFFKFVKDLEDKNAALQKEVVGLKNQIKWYKEDDEGVIYKLVEELESLRKELQEIKNKIQPPFYLYNNPLYDKQKWFEPYSIPVNPFNTGSNPDWTNDYKVWCSNQGKE